MKNATPFLAVLATLTGFIGDAQAATITETLTFRQGLDGYVGTSDTYLDNTDPNNAHGSEATIVNGGNSGRLGLVRFDDIFGGGANQVPLVPSLTIDSATLFLNAVAGNAGTTNVESVQGAWDESSTRSGVINALTRTDIGDFFPNIGQNSIDVTAVVQDWADGTLANDGFAFFRSGPPDQEFASSEYTADPTLRPTLEVTFTYIPEPGAAGLLGLGCALIGVRRRRG